MSFVDNLKKERSKVYYIKTLEQEIQCHYFIMVDNNKTSEFNKALQSSDEFNISEYGEVVYQIKGAEVPDFIKKEMLEKYDLELPIKSSE